MTEAIGEFRFFSDKPSWILKFDDGNCLRVFHGRYGGYKSKVHAERSMRRKAKALGLRLTIEDRAQ